MTLALPFISHNFSIEFQSVIGRLTSLNPAILSKQVTDVSQFDLKPEEGGIIRITFRQDTDGDVMRELSSFILAMAEDADSQIVLNQFNRIGEVKLKIKLQDMNGHISYSPLNYGIANEPHAVVLIVHYQKWSVV